jgi:hypothetical protein
MFALQRILSIIQLAHSEKFSKMNYDEDDGNGDEDCS